MMGRSIVAGDIGRERVTPDIQSPNGPPFGLKSYIFNWNFHHNF